MGAGGQVHRWLRWLLPSMSVIRREREERKKSGAADDDDDDDRDEEEGRAMWGFSLANYDGCL